MPSMSTGIQKTVTKRLIFYSMSCWLLILPYGAFGEETWIFSSTLDLCRYPTVLCAIPSRDSRRMEHMTQLPDDARQNLRLNLSEIPRALAE